MSNELPDAVSKAFEVFGECEVPAGLNPEVRDIYIAGSERRCMTCFRDIGEESLVVIADGGMHQVYCSHRCLTDLMVIGYLGQAYDDLKQGIDFRGQS